MSLMQRVERAQQAQQAQQEGGEPAPPNALVPVPPPVNVASRNLREDMLRDLRCSTRSAASARSSRTSTMSP